MDKIKTPPVRRKSTRQAPVSLAPPVERRAPDELERRAVNRAVGKLGDARARYEVKYDPERSSVVSPHSDLNGYTAVQAAAFGTTSSAFARNAIDELASVLKGQNSKPTEQALNAAFAMIDGGEPANELEATLLIQMAATHSVAMQCLLTAAGDLRLATDGGVGNLSVKLLRTFTGQIEALTKLRRGGEQVVRHIHVDNRGGQAVIAETVNTGGVGNGKGTDQSQGRALDGVFGTEMLGQNTAGDGVPIPGSKGTATLQDARRNEPGRA